LKIFILPTIAELQPTHQPFLYPSHNDDYGVEQDFLIWLKKNPQFLVSTPSQADWHYLPVYWTRWYLNHDFGNSQEDLNKIQHLVDQIIIDDKKTFTIAQYDDGPKINVGKAIQFLASPQTEGAIPIPLLCKKHKLPPIKSPKKYLASFNGSFETHPIRAELRKALEANPLVLLESGSTPKRFLARNLTGNSFVNNIIRSYVGLAPRGYGGSSFRFFEIMQLGTAPCYIGEWDVRPFKKFINWNEISYYVKDINELEELLANLDKNEARRKGKAAKSTFNKELYYQKWCKYVIKELNELNRSN
jgi:hypothetical protein